MDHAEIQQIGVYSQHLAQGLKHEDGHYCLLNRCLDLIILSGRGRSGTMSLEPHCLGLTPSPATNE